MDSAETFAIVPLAEYKQLLILRDTHSRKKAIQQTSVEGKKATTSLVGGQKFTEVASSEETTSKTPLVEGKSRVELSHAKTPPPPGLPRDYIANGKVLESETSGSGPHVWVGLWESIG